MMFEEGDTVNFICKSGTYIEELPYTHGDLITGYIEHIEVFFKSESDIKRHYEVIVVHDGKDYLYILHDKDIFIAPDLNELEEM